MVVVTPNSFLNLPEYLRPKEAIQVNRNFKRKVNHIRKYGTRSDSEEVANVADVLNTMRQTTPHLFRRQRTRKGRGRTRHRSRQGRQGRQGVKKQTRRS
jgi:hypothetical protein